MQGLWAGKRDLQIVMKKLHRFNKAERTGNTNFGLIYGKLR